MELTPLQSLKCLATRKLALTVYNKDIKHFCDEVVLTEKFNVDDPFNVDVKEEKWLRKCEEEARKYIDNRLTEELEDNVVNLLRPIIDEIHYWIRDHFYVIKHIDRTLYMNSLCWKWELTIDRIKVATLFVQNESIDKRVRFIMACIYFWQTDVLNLWQRMTEDERDTVFKLNPNIAVHFWLEWLENEANSPWTLSVKKYLTFDLVYKIKSNSRIRLRSFFTQLSKRNKIFFIQDLFFTKRAHSDDLLVCFNLMDEFERADTIPSFLRPIDVLGLYLNWPLQSQFLKAVKDMESYLNRHSYENGLEFIVYRKIMRGMQDFDYRQLLKDLWQLTPDEHKEKIKKMKIFTVVQIAINYDKKTHTLPIEEVLKAHLRSTDVFLD